MGVNTSQATIVEKLQSANVSNTVHSLGVYGGFSSSLSGQPSTDPWTKLDGSFIS